jgi:hypothetical protein
MELIGPGSFGMGREIPQKYLRSKRAVRELLGFARGPEISPPNPKKTRVVNKALAKMPGQKGGSLHSVDRLWGLE